MNGNELLKQLVDKLENDQKESYTRRAARHAEQALEAMEDAIMELKKAVNFLDLSENSELLQVFWNLQNGISCSKTALRDTIKKI